MRPGRRHPRSGDADKKLQLVDGHGPAPAPTLRALRPRSIEPAPGVQEPGMAHSPGGSPWLCGSPEVKIDSFRMCSGCGCMGSLMQAAAQPHCSVVVESSQLEVLVPVESWPRWYFDFDFDFDFGFGVCIRMNTLCRVCMYVGGWPRLPVLLPAARARAVGPHIHTCVCGCCASRLWRTAASCKLQVSSRWFSAGGRGTGL